MESMCAYWKEVIRHANHQTLTALGYGEWRRAWISPLIFLTSLFVVRLISGKTQMSDELMWGLSVAVALLAVYMPLFIYNIVRAPDRIHSNLSNENKALKSSISEKHLTVMARIQHHSSSKSARVCVDVKNNTAVTIRNVMASVDSITNLDDGEIDPQQASCIIGAALEIDSRQDHSSPSLTTVDLHPGQSISFNVAGVNITPANNVFNLARTRKLQTQDGQVHYTVSGSSAIPAGHYKVVVVVRGEDAPPQHKSFDFLSHETEVRVVEVDGSR